MWHFIRLLACTFCLCALTNSVAVASAPVDKIIVYKSQNKMDLLDVASRPLKSYVISLGGNPKGHKTQEGDRKTPEGIYTISARNLYSRYHLSLRISYPHVQDTAQAVERGVSAGGDIMIHGLRYGLGWLGSWHQMFNWTNGCIAVTNNEIEEIWNLVADGTTIEIRP
jgi:murein L,D-transpeptidase YafK